MLIPVGGMIQDGKLFDRFYSGGPLSQGLRYGQRTALSLHRDAERPNPGVSERI